MVALCDAVVGTCRMFTDDLDERPWPERLDEMMNQRARDGDAKVWTHGLQVLATNESIDLSELVGRISDTNYLNFARRLLGAAEYDRLATDLRHDAAVVILAIRRGVRALMPLGVAWEDALGILTPNQLDSASIDDVLAFGVLRMLVELDHTIGDKALPRLPMDLAGATDVDLRATDGTDLVRLAHQFRVVVADASQSQVEDVNIYLTRKLKGAHDALEHSADGISQAANSLIELVDRLFRETFPKDVVLAWLDAQLPNDPKTTYTDNGVRKPTKYGEAMCFVHKGGTVNRTPTDTDNGLGPTVFHRLTAQAIVQARNELQLLKHTDGGPGDRAAMEKALAAIEGAVVIAMRVGWKTAQVPAPDVIDLADTPPSAGTS